MLHRIPGPGYLYTKGSEPTATVMRIRDDKQRFSVATLLLCLLAAFAVSPPEACNRTQGGRSTRTVRAVRLDDHDHDHALEAGNLSFDLNSVQANDRPLPFLLPHLEQHSTFAFVGIVAPVVRTVAACRFAAPSRGRAPPSFLLSFS